MTNRRGDILDAAAELIGEHGYHGMKLKQLADKVGISNAGILHYFDGKNGILMELLENEYDIHNDAWAYIRPYLEKKDMSPLLLPEFYRRVAQYNDSRPQMVRLFTVLNTESLQMDHPAHDYFVERETRFWKQVSSVRWALPEGVDLHTAFHTANSTMDGMQIRWLRQQRRQTLVSMWHECESIIFPSKLWDGPLPATFEPSTSTVSAAA